jgi:RNA polymerase sigma factor (sigma-70 family)
MVPSETLQPLLNRACAGDAAALNDLVGHLRSYVRERLGGWVGKDAVRLLDASEIAQVAMLKFFNHFSRLRGPVLPLVLGFVRTIACNTARDQLRALRYRPPGAGDWAGLTPEDPAPSPEEQALAREEWTRLDRVLDRLPRARREVLRLRFQEGRPLQEIAERVGKSYAAVAVTLCRAVQQLREALEKEP